MSLFVVFEGIEGCGKTTQIKRLGSYLGSRKLPYTVTREPGGTPVGEEIRKIFLHSDNKDNITPLTELLLVTASRVQHIHQIIKPALNEKKIVLCDRFSDATVAYQGYAGGVPLSVIYRCHELFLDSIKPDLTILLDCPVDVGLGRSRSRNRAEGKQREEGRFEEKALKFHEKVRQGYLDIAGKEPGRFRIIDSEQSVESIHEEVCLVIIEKLREKGYAV
jgi:dTMP kinase